MKSNNRLGNAWLLLTISFSIHVVDEALNNFLDLWNPIAKISGFLPDFTFTQWLSGLIVAVLTLFILSKYAFQQKKWIIYLSLGYGLIMLLNGIGHLTLSIYWKEFVPGVYSSPLLIITSVYLIWTAIKSLASKSYV